jgi:hypothetical protein
MTTQNHKYIIAFQKHIETDGVHNGDYFDISNFAGERFEAGFILVSEEVLGGKAKLQDIQLSNDTSFLVGVETIGASFIDHFGAGDTTSSVDALSQTEISASKTLKKLAFHVPKANKKYARLRVVSSNSADMRLTIVAELTQQRMPVNQ